MHCIPFPFDCSLRWFPSLVPFAGSLRWFPSLVPLDVPFDGSLR
jgi:hypothetical protein